MTIKRSTLEEHVNSGIGMPVTTKKEAEEAGLRFFWTGEPCTHGHHSKKRTVGGGCVACQFIASNAQKIRESASKKQLRAQKREEQIQYNIGNKDRLKFLEIYSETGDMEQASVAIKRTVADMQVCIARSPPLANDVHALEKRLRIANGGILVAKYRPVDMEWSEDKYSLFLRAYVDTGDIQAAREAIGCSPSEFNAELERNEEFSIQVEKARPQAEQALEEKAIQLALAGNDKLLTVILKAKKPEYKDKIQIEQTTTIKHDDKTINARIAHLLNKYQVVDAEFTKLGFVEQTGQGRITSESGGIGSQASVQQAPVYVSRDGRVVEIEVSEASGVL